MTRSMKNKTLEYLYDSYHHPASRQTFSQRILSNATKNKLKVYQDKEKKKFCVPHLTRPTRA